MGIEYVTGDATEPLGDGPRIIVHICNDAGAWGRGFTAALSKKWKQPGLAYLSWANGHGLDPFRLGAAQLIAVEPNLWVANLIAQRGIGKAKKPIRYGALKEALSLVALFVPEGATVHMPRIGTGLAGGKWEAIEPIIQEQLVARGIPVMVYDLPE